MKKYLLLLLLIMSFSIQAKPGLLEKLGLNDDIDSAPDVDSAFNFTAEVQDANTLKGHWSIAEGNYLYRNKITFKILNTDQVEIGHYVLPAGSNKEDDIFGLTEVYLHDITVPLPLIRKKPQAMDIKLYVRYQGCSETFHICYPPVEKTVILSLPAIADIKTTTTSLSSPSLYDEPVSQPEQLAQSLAQGLSFTVLLSFFGLGLLLSFTPCVFPMIPILSSIIIGEGEKTTTHRAFILSLSYVLAMSVTYTAAGVLTGLLGENLQSLFQNPWIIGSFSALFILLALSMFGLYELQLPQSLQHRLHQISHRQQGGHIMGAVLMGLLSGLIVGPCLAPPLAGALIFIGQQGDPVLGGAALLSLSLGMGVPLLIIGTSTGSLLPKAGDWMETIKAIFGVLMIGLAFWMLERILPGWISLLLWGGLLIISAAYLGAFSSLTIDATGWQKLWKGVGVILLIYGSLLIIGGASGNQHIWHPLAHFNLQQGATAQKLHFSRVTSLAELKQRLAQSQKPVMLDFYADWCVDCKKMEAETFSDAAVMSALQNFTLLQVDITANTEQDKAILKYFSVFGPPTILFFDTQGKEYRAYRLIGTISANQLRKHLAALPVNG